MAIALSLQFTWSINWLLFCCILKLDITVDARIISFIELNLNCMFVMYFDFPTCHHRPSFHCGFYTYFVFTSFLMKWIYTANALENFTASLLVRLGAKSTPSHSLIYLKYWFMEQTLCFMFFSFFGSCVEDVACWLNDFSAH